MKITQKRVKLDNGKTVIVDVPAKSDGKNPLKELASLFQSVKNLKPCD